MRRHSFFALAIIAAVAACSDFPEPEALDAAPLYGCYAAAGSPSLAVEATGVKIAGAGAAIPYRYEMHKIGAVLKMPVAAEMVGRKRSFQRSDDHFYRVLFVDGQPAIRVAFGKEGNLSDYVRYTSNDCRT
ncbi:MAG TPA: hypothetical protein VF475_11990 [Sphingobium sp.]